MSEPRRPNETALSYSILSINILSWPEPDVASKAVANSMIATFLRLPSQLLNLAFDQCFAIVENHSVIRSRVLIVMEIYDMSRVLNIPKTSDSCQDWLEVRSIAVYKDEEHLYTQGIIS